MKKLLLILTIIAGTTFSASAQSPVMKGNILVDAYYGFPNLYGAILQSAVETGSSTDVTAQSIGPVGFRAEYLASDKLGVGIDFCYSDASVSQTDMGADGNTYEYKISSPKIGFMATINYHIVTTDVVDFYFITGAGYKSRSLKASTDDPDYTTESVDVSLTNLAARIGLGTRIFFTENIGVNIGVGFGQGSVLNGGVSFKF